MDWLNTIIHGDLFDVLPNITPNSIDAVITSPPYAQQRQKQYGGITEAEYPEWTVSWMETVRPLLTEHANVAIVIRPHVKDGQISDYILKTRLAVRAAGWREIEELLWIKPAAPPLGHVQRPRRSWESILWFSRSKTPWCNPTANGSPSDRLGLESSKGMGDYLHDKQARETGSGIARCRDYVEVSTNEVDKDPRNTHPAQYPEALAAWLLRLLCPPTGTVLDPFAGSGTTLLAARRLGMGYVGTEISQEYAEIAQRRLSKLTFFDQDQQDDPLFSFQVC